MVGVCAEASCARWLVVSWLPGTRPGIEINRPSSLFNHRIPLSLSSNLKMGIAGDSSGLRGTGQALCVH